jgi:Na+-transporting methylmalonyl-CoA/oxaloacetate decarboxylase gamma subunit
MDDNTAIILAAAIATIPGTVAAVFSYLAILQARKTASVVTEVKHQTNSLVEERIETEKRVGIANAAVARREGADDAVQAIAVAATATVQPVEPT